MSGLFVETYFFKFEVPSFHSFGAIYIINRSAAHTQTHIKRKQYLRHSLRSLGRDKN